MKTSIVAFVLLLGTFPALAGRPFDVNEKVLKLFHETFKNPKEVAWHEFEEYYEVSFKDKEVQTTVRYDADGNVLRCLRYYSGSQLPLYILSSLKKQYPDLSIFGVTEFFNGTELAYLVTMQDNKHWYTIKSDPIGNLEQTEKLKKS
jgi:hypothetical protein